MNEFKHDTHTCVYEYSFPNGKRYIGITKDVKRRRGQHKNDIFLISRAIRKYEGDYTFKILGIFEDIEAAKVVEVGLIKAYNTMAPNGYNLTEGGDGCVASEETRLRMSTSQRGKTHSKESVRKMSEAKMGIPRSEETKRKLSKANKGKKLSEETKRKMSEAHKGRTFSQESIRKMSEAQKGRNVSEETRRKISYRLKMYHANKGVN